MSKPNQYDVGDVVRIKGDFTSTAGSPANPTVVKAWVKPPNSSVRTYTLADFSNPVVGTFTYDLELNSSGLWSYRFFSTASLKASGQSTFIVRRMLVGST